MLDKKSKQFIKALINVEKTNPKVPLNLIPIPMFVNDLPYDKDQAEGVAEYLINMDYLTWMRIDEDLCVHTTYMGSNFFEFDLIEIKAFFIKSIITPIMVSCITAVMVSFII